MAVIIYPSGDDELRVDALDFFRRRKDEVFPSGLFCPVPLLEGLACGYSMYVDDDGLFLGLPINKRAMFLAGYFHSPVCGPAFICSYEEADEEGVEELVHPVARATFELRLRELTRVTRVNEN